MGEVTQSDGEPKFESVFGGIQAFAGQVLDPGNPVAHGVPMYVQRVGGHVPHSVGLQEGAQCGEELLALLGGIQWAEDGIDICVQNSGGNTGQDEPATGHICRHDYFIAQPARGKRRDGLAKGDREGAGAHTGADPRGPAACDPAHSFTQIHTAGDGYVHDIADRAEKGVGKDGGQVGREAVRVVLGDGGAAQVLSVRPTEASRRPAPRSSMVARASRSKTRARRRRSATSSV